MATSNPATTRLEGRYYALAVCWILGNGCLLAWNSMLTIVDYYGYLFPQYHPSRILTLIYQSFAIGALSVLVYKEAKLNTRRRNLFGYGIFSLGSLAVLVLDLATSGKGGIGSFIGVCVISAAFGLADAHVQGGMIGDLSLMTPEFVQSFLAGLAASGALTSGLRLVTKAAFKNSRDGLRKGATLFFAISVLFELVCLVLYALVFPKLPIVKYYRTQAAAQGSQTVSADLAAGGIQELPTRQAEEAPISNQRLNNRDLFLLNIDYAINLFLVYLLTLSIFPGFLSEDTGKHSLGDWYALVLIAVFNVSDLVGRYVPARGQEIEDEVEKTSLDNIIWTFLVDSSFLFHSQIWKPRLDDFLDVVFGINQWVFDCLYPHISPSRLLGTGAKCTRKLVGAMFVWRDVCRSHL